MANAALSTSKIAISIAETLTKAQALSSDGTVPVKLNPNYSWSDGTSDDEANRLYFASGTLTLSTDVDIDLYGSLTDPFGDTISMDTVKAIIVANTSDERDTPTTAKIQVGGGSNGAGLNAFDTWVTSTAADGSEAAIIHPGGLLVAVAPLTGYACSAGSDILRIYNSDGTYSADYQVIVVGVKT